MQGGRELQCGWYGKSASVQKGVDMAGTFVSTETSFL